MCAYVSFNSYPDCPPGQPKGQRKFHAQNLRKISCTKCPVAAEIFLANARGPDAEKWHILNNFYEQKHLVLSNDPGTGEKLTVKCSGSGVSYVQMQMMFRGNGQGRN